MSESATVDYWSGLDLGQTTDPTAFATLERSQGPAPLDPAREVNLYRVRYLTRVPLGTPYTDVCDRVKRWFAGPPLAGTTLAVDQTGVGRPVVDMLRRAEVNARLRPITITFGSKATTDILGGYCVPKVELVSTLQVLLQQRRLKVAEGLVEATTLVKELQNFQVRVTKAANEVYGAWRDGTNDDLCFTVMIACWLGERGRRAMIY